MKPERIIKLYEKGKKRFYFQYTVITIFGMAIIAYLGFNMLDIDLFSMSWMDGIYLALFIAGLIFIIKNIFIEVAKNSWKEIETQYSALNEEKEH